jgi:hypothetical protein
LPWLRLAAGRVTFARPDALECDHQPGTTDLDPAEESSFAGALAGPDEPAVKGGIGLDAQTAVGQPGIESTDGKTFVADEAGFAAPRNNAIAKPLDERGGAMGSTAPAGLPGRRGSSARRRTRDYGMNAGTQET